MAKVSAALYKTDRDDSMTPLSTGQGSCGQPVRCPVSSAPCVRTCAKARFMQCMSVFSKKFEKRSHAFALYFVLYGFCRVQGRLS
jgi:hypothetical protein